MAKKQKPEIRNPQSAIVGIVMGSDSDWPAMKAAAETLAEFGIDHEVRVISAHRTPAVAAQYAASAVDRGLRVLIAGAGGAAHLAGVLAAHTPLPVIGVPISATALQGFDALLATVAVGGAKNAALLAIQILGAGDAALRAKMGAYKADMASKVAARDRNLQAETKKT